MAWVVVEHPCHVLREAVYDFRNACLFPKSLFAGPEAFSKEFEITRKLLVGAQGIPLREFLLTPPEDWLD